MNTVQLSNIAVLKGIIGGPFGSDLTSTDYVDSGIPVIRGSNMLPTGKIGGGFVYISNAKFESSLNRNSAEAEDIIFTQRGTLGQVAQISQNDSRKFVISQSQMRLRVNKKIAVPRFVFYACRTQDFLRAIDDLAIRTGVPHINLSILKEMTIPSPPLESQRAIAEVLSALDDKIAANEHMIAAGKGLLRSRWEQLTSNSTDTVELQDIAEINPKVPTVKEETASYLDMKNLPEHGLLVSEWGSREPKGGARFQNGDTLIARITPCFENGKAAWVDFLEADEVCYGSTEYIVMRPCRGVPDIVPYLVGTSDHFREFASQRRTGTSGRQRVQAKELSDYSVRIPEAVQLNEFRSFAEPLLQRLGAARTESRTLAATRDELLPLLMSGKITVADAEKRISE